MAVRQGLDVLLPSDQERRDNGRLEQDELLNRLLRTWTALMVCGVYATNMGSREEHTLDDNLREGLARAENKKRWAQWCHLNWLSSLVILPRCEAIEKWFVDRDWSIGPPSLASRARVLARMALCLAGEPKEDRSQSDRAGVAPETEKKNSKSDGPVFQRGNALEHLYEELRKGPITPPHPALVTQRPVEDEGLPRGAAAGSQP
jgi:hypothetical protein